MVDDYLSATAQHDDAPYFAFSQSPCWLWRNGDCSAPADPDVLGPSHKAFAAGTVPRAGPGNYTEVATFFGRLASCGDLDTLLNVPECHPEPASRTRRR